MRKEIPSLAIDSTSRPTVIIREEIQRDPRLPEMFSEISESIRRLVLRHSKCNSFTMIVESLILLSVLSVSVGEPSFQKCCLPGLVFSGSSKFHCDEEPSATQLLSIDLSDDNRTYEIPSCEKPEHIATTFLRGLSPTDYLQKPYCIEILYNQTTRQSEPTLVHCKSNEDRDQVFSTHSQAPPLPQIFDVRRCCSNDTVFNVKTGSCDSMSDISDDYSQGSDILSLLPEGLREFDFLNVHRGTPRCSGAIFTYEVEAKDITFKNGTLQLKLPRKEGGDESLTINVSNSCLELTPGVRLKQGLVIRVCRDSDFCHDKLCVQKCCDDDVQERSKLCKKIDGTHSRMNFYEELANIMKTSWDVTDYGVMFGLTCRNSMYKVNYTEIILSPKGYLYYPGAKTTTKLKHDMYCLEPYNAVTLDGLFGFVCYGDDEVLEKDSGIKYVISSTLQGISCIFLLLTLIVYACLPSLQNLHGKTLMCHAASLMAGYFCLAIVPSVTPAKRWVEDTYATRACSALGFTMLFFFLSAFCWLNVMCFDIWRTFGSLRGNTSRGRSHVKRFLLYCLYAWGLSLSITIVGILSDMTDILPLAFKSNVGIQRCWFSDKLAESILFRVPVAIQLIMNVLFFILTAQQCSKVKAEISRLAEPVDPRRKRFQANKIKFIMNVKLFVVMGIFWVTEIIASFIKEYTDYRYVDEVSYVPDVLNSLQGVMIFILFVVKHRVHQALRKRLGLDSRKKASCSQGTSMLREPFRIKMAKEYHQIFTVTGAIFLMQN
ncbi:PREDICTED: G-protein coupled receptor Mth-like [Eufriesea mexicana]|uniref:G-protein coupled receptor Mth-like n=1 Tax=Eufriesea mexicana TaxID=516756 RepID=UPI00083BBDC6|nr:PREDICTED: G-protein coupled receptor Mth-like [Eufriesea mexicana]